MNSALDDEKLLRLAERVRELRISKGLTQNDAFADTGIHFGRIEQGKRDISFTTLCKLADYFGVSINELR